MTMFNNMETECRTCEKSIEVGQAFKRCTICVKLREQGGEINENIDENQDQCLECQNTKFCENCQPYG
jgi:hypothetical protein